MTFTMITIETENYNYISQDFYDNVINSIDLNQISCTCGLSGSLIFYGSYKRKVQLQDRVIVLTIATGKAKIERWFRTMKDQWMATLDMQDFHSLDELRGSLHSYVQRYNQTPHSSLHGKSPQDRFFSEPEQIRRIPDEQIDKDFLLEIERRVSADSVIIIDQIEYEVDYRFAKQRIRLRYSPDMKDIFVVETDGSLTPIRVLNKIENAQIKREKVRLCKGDE